MLNRTLKSSNPRRIAVNPNPNVDLSTQNHVTRRISQGHSLHQVWTLRDHSFLSYAPDISVKNTLIDRVTLTFEPQNSTTSRVSKGNSLYQVWTLWVHPFFELCCGQTNRQTDRQTDSKILPTPTDSQRGKLS